jgi:hypothetical protein
VGPSRGDGIFYDRPSAAFINTVFSNYPFLREQEVTFPGSAVPMNGAWSQQDPTFPFNQYLPNRVVRTTGANGTYQVCDGTNVTLGADGTPNPTDPATGLPTRGNIAETFEFRASSTTSGPARARGQHDDGGAVLREQGHRPARKPGLQLGLRPQRAQLRAVGFLESAATVTSHEDSGPCATLRSRRSTCGVNARFTNRAGVTCGLR